VSLAQRLIFDKGQAGAEEKISETVIQKFLMNFRCREGKNLA